MRKLKHHEQRLLRKTNFLEWRITDTKNEHFYISKYLIQKREDYYTYKKLRKIIARLTESIAGLPDVQKEKYTRTLASRLHSHGLVPNTRLVSCSRVRIDSFCERRLPTLMKRSGMVENLRDAVRFVEQGHVRIGNTRVSDPAVLVSRGMDNFISWVDNSKLKRKIKEFNEEADDYDAL